jgi:hypothetical protein
MHNVEDASICDLLRTCVVIQRIELIHTYQPAHSWDIMIYATYIFPWRQHNKLLVSSTVYIQKKLKKIDESEKIIHNGEDSITGLRRKMVLRARQWRHRLVDGAYVVDGVTSSGQGRWQRVKGLDHGQE